jgi:hypothetical protein
LGGCEGEEREKLIGDSPTNGMNGGCGVSDPSCSQCGDRLPIAQSNAGDSNIRRLAKDLSNSKNMVFNVKSWYAMGWT